MLNANAWIALVGLFLLLGAHLVAFVVWSTRHDERLRVAEERLSKLDDREREHYEEGRRRFHDTNNAFARRDLTIERLKSITRLPPYEE